MSAPGTFTVVNDDALCAAIAATAQTLVYVAPGISKPVVEAIGQSLDTKTHLLATVIVDLDPEVYRMGYGTEEGLRALQALAQQQHLELRQQPGLRVGLLVTDQQTLVYSPTPLLIEAGSTTEEKPNAIVISRGSDSTASLMRACGAVGSPDQTTPAPRDAEIGRAPATPQQVDESLSELKETPPKKFDVARIERVYESKIQFVEIELTGYRLSAKRVNIPNDLLVGEDKAFKERLKNSFLLLQGEDSITVDIPDFDPKTLESTVGADGQTVLDPKTLKPKTGVDGKPLSVRWSEVELEAQRKALHDDFLISVPRFGQVIMRRNRAAFDARVALLRRQIDAFNEAVQGALGERLIDAIFGLAKALLPRIRDKRPARYERVLLTSKPTDEDLMGLLERDLEKSFGTSAEIFKPELRCVYKDVTYESISDSRFKQALSEALRGSGGERLVQQLFSEHDSAPEARPK